MKGLEEWIGAKGLLRWVVCDCLFLLPYGVGVYRGYIGQRGAGTSDA